MLTSCVEGEKEASAIILVLLCTSQTQPSKHNLIMRRVYSNYKASQLSQAGGTFINVVMNATASALVMTHRCSGSGSGGFHAGVASLGPTRDQLDALLREVSKLVPVAPSSLSQVSGPLHAAATSSSVSASHLLRLVHDAFGSDQSTGLSYADLREAMVRMPDVYTVIEGPERSSWSVVRAADLSSSPQSSSSSSSTNASPVVASSATSSATTTSTLSRQPVVDPEEIAAILSLRQDIKKALRELSSSRTRRNTEHDDKDVGKYVSLKAIVQHCNWSRAQYELALSTVLPHALQLAVNSKAEAALKAAQSSSSILEGLECKPVLRIRPKQKRRGFHVFVDADGLTKREAQDALDLLAVDQRTSTHVVVRHASTGAHGAHDTITTYDMPPYLLLEKHARVLCAGHGKGAPVLKDLVFVCSDALFEVYARSVGPKTLSLLRPMRALSGGDAGGAVISNRSSVLSANIYVCTPTQVAKMQDANILR